MLNNVLRITFYEVLTLGLRICHTHHEQQSRDKEERSQKRVTEYTHRKKRPHSLHHD